MTAITWKSGVNGDWSTAADWAGGKIPGAADDVTIGAAGSYTVTIYYAQRANSLTVNAANAKVVDSAQLTLGSTLSVAAGTFTLSSGGEIVGGTISTSGSGSFLSTGGTLSGVTYQGALGLGTGSSLYLLGSNAFVGASGAGAGTISMSAAASLYVEDKTTLDNATLTIAAGNTSDFIDLYSQSSNNPTLTLGSHFNLVQSATANRTTINLYNYVNNSGSFINQGTITADAKNGVLSIYGPNGGIFTNQGLIAISNNDTVSLQTNVSNTSLGSFTTATGGALRLESGYTLSNTGATLALGSGAQLTLAGTIAGGTVTDSGSGLVSSNGTLSGVTYQGTLAVGSSLSVVGGLNVSTGGGSGIINDTGANSYLYLYDTQTLDDATLNLGNNSGYSYLYIESDNGQPATLTFGSHFNLDEAGKNAQFNLDPGGNGNDALVNKGTITAAIGGGLLRIYGEYAGDSFTNQGLIAASNNDTIALNTNVTTSGLGSFTTASGGALRLESGYTLSNAGATLALGSGSQLTLAGTIAGGTVTDSGSGLVSSSGTLSGVTYQGMLTVGASTSLNVVGGLNVSSGGGTGIINDTGASSFLYFTDTQTLDNATLNLGANVGGAYLNVENSTGQPATLTLGSHLALDQAGKYAQINIDPQGYGDSALVNDGTITAATSGGTLSIFGQYTGDYFANHGLIAVSNNDTLQFDTNISGLGSFTTGTGGALKLSSGYTLSNAGATLALGTGAQLTLGGTITGGTIADSGSGLVSQGGTLSGVTYQGTLTVGTSITLSVVGGLNVVTGGGNGIINDTGSYASLDLYDTQTLDNATLNLGNGTSYARLFVYEDNNNPATLTLGKDFDLNQVGKTAYIYTDNQDTGNALVNQGTITAGINGGNLYVEGYYTDATFTNQGLIGVSNNDTVQLDTDVTTSGLGSFTTATGGQLLLGSGYTLANAGATLTLNGASQLGLAGTIAGGTVVDNGSGLVSQAGTLSGVAYQGTLTIAANTALGISGGINVSSGVINETGASSSLYLYDTQTLSNATLNIGSNSSDQIYINDDNGEPATLTLADTFDITQAGRAAYIYIDQQQAGNALINQGTITAGISGGQLYIEDFYYDSSKGFINQGLIAVTNNDTVILATGLTTAGLGSFTTATGGAVLFESGQTLSNTGATLALGTGSQLTLAGTIAGGTVADSGGGLIAQGGTLAGVTYQGTLAIGDGGSLDVAGGLNVTTGIINDTGAGAYLNFLDTQTLDRATLDIGSSNGSAYIYILEDTGKAATLTLGGQLSLATAGKSAQIVLDNQNAGNALINQGTITAGTNGGVLTLSGPYAKDSLTNTGSLVATNGATLDFSNVGTFKNASAGTLTGGYYEADAHSILQITSNLSIATDAATIVLSGTGSVFESLKTSNSVQVTLDKSLTGIASTGTLALLAGRGFAASAAFSDAGLLKLGGGVFAAASGLTLAAGAHLTGSGSVTGGIADGGTAEAAGGTLLLSGAITGSGALLVDAGATLELGGSTTASETVSFNGQGGVLKLDNAAGFASPIAGFAAGDTIGIGTLTASAAAISGQTLAITLSNGTVLNETLQGSAASQRAGVSADGHSITDFRYAQASLAPQPVALGNHHVGDAVSAIVILTNTGAADGFTEKLDAAAAGASGGISAAGSLAGLAAGQSDGTDLTLTLATNTAGAVSGTGSFALSTDGSGSDGGAPLSLGTQTVAGSGAVFAYAAPTLSAITLDFGAGRLGDTVAGQVLTITDGASASAYQESLDYALNAAGGFAGGGGGMIASGGSASVTLSLDTAVSGDFTGTQASIGLASDGGAIGDGLGTTALAGQTVTLNGKVYATAVVQLATTTLNFGVVHVGDTGANTVLSLGLTNAASGALTDELASSIGYVSGGFTGSMGTVPGFLDAGASGAYQFSIATGSSGTLTSTTTLFFNTYDHDLGSLSLDNGTLTLAGTVDNYAVAALAETAGGGTLTQNGTAYTLDLGQVAQGSTPLTVALAALNAATGTADLLGGTLTASGSSAFSNTGLGAFSGLAAGQSYGASQVTFSTSNAGTFTETITLASAGSNASGYSGALAAETFSITGTVVSSTGKTYVLTKKPVTITGGSANDTFVAGGSTLVAGDRLDGGGGSNTLSLTGGGTFSLTTPAALADIAAIAAQEGQAAGGGQAATLQTVTLRAGLDATVNVAAANLSGANPNPAAITINGAANNDVINLGGGTDTVAGLGLGETVHAGSGIALVQAVAANAGAAVIGQSGASTTLEVTNAGTIALGAQDTYLTVRLDKASTLHLNGMGFVAAIGSITGSDSLFAGAANQILSGNGGKDTLTGFSGGGDTFLDTTKAVAGDTVGNWTTGDVLDITDMSPGTARITGFQAGKLSVTDGTHKASIAFTGSLAAHDFVVLGSDGHGGTLFGYHV